MRYTKAFLTLSFLSGLALNIANAQPMRGPVQGPAAPAAPEAAPTFELDKKNKNKRDHINFTLNPKPISDANMKFSHFANRKLMIFYFSAKCPHCQQAFPHVQKLSDELTAQGFSTIAIAIKYNSEDDIRGFIRDYKVHVPVFQDEDRSFGENYGTGSIPLTLIVNDKGEYIRYKTFEAEQTPKMIKTEASQLASK
jgi:thiol-disulfide isomerase/thioredoxin